ncbi:M20/M25/M40 family metallo-hydrolase [Chelativorans sp. J32]|uniref:M20/M25/M40 family metallo-hydrolase n=1 Tax=Chelativorans sp. J32 TaxID=935840 RepID=UPI0004853AE5
MTSSPQKGRDRAIARALAYVENGTFEKDLARRVALRTESQKIPDSLPLLYRYLKEEIAPAFERMGFTTRIYDNPVKGKPPVLLATRIEDPSLPTVLGYGHGDVQPGLDEQWTEGNGPWVLAHVGDKLYGRGAADNKGQHTLNMAALEAVLAERGGRFGFNVKFMLETGEEVGTPGLAQLVAAHKDDFAPTERVYASNVFQVLALLAGTPEHPVGAVPAKAVANCQMRFVAGTDAKNILPALQKHIWTSTASPW